MKRIAFLLLAVAILAGISAFIAPSSGHADGGGAPIFVTDIPPGYRDWRLISVAHEEDERNDFRAVLGNDTAIKAYWGNKLPFPDGTIVMRIAWSYGPSEENNRIFVRAQSLVPGLPTGSYPQFMVKNSKKYAASLPLRRRSKPDRNNF